MPLPSEYEPKLWLALLAEIDRAGGKVRPNDIYPKMQSHFPEITESDITLTRKSGGNVWTNVIQWARMKLVYCGCIDNSTRGVWAITNTGRDWLQREWRGDDADYSGVMMPALVNQPSKSKSKSVSTTTASASGGPPRGGQVTEHPATPANLPSNSTESSHSAVVTAMLSPTDKLCQKLRVSQRQSHTPIEFERDLTEAFAALGFETIHVGGAGDTDIVVTAMMGQTGYSAIIDAKSTQSGKVSEAQISWPVIDSHRKARGATFAAVIGEDFGGGQLKTFASQYNVTLITTEMVCELLKLHADAPFNLHELRFLFDQPGRADDGMQALRESNRRSLRHWQLIGEIVDTFEKFQRATPNGSAPKVDNIHFHLMLKNSQPPVSAPTFQEVEDAVRFLASRAVNVLIEVPGSNGAFQLATTSSVARERLLAIARHFDRTPGIEATASSQSGQLKS